MSICRIGDVGMYRRHVNDIGDPDFLLIVERSSPLFPPRIKVFTSAETQACENVQISHDYSIFIIQDGPLYHSLHVSRESRSGKIKCIIYQSVQKLSSRRSAKPVLPFISEVWWELCDNLRFRSMSILFIFICWQVITKLFPDLPKSTRHHVTEVVASNTFQCAIWA